MTLPSGELIWESVQWGNSMMWSQPAGSRIWSWCRNPTWSKKSVISLRRLRQTAGKSLCWSQDLLLPEKQHFPIVYPFRWRHMVWNRIQFLWMISIATEKRHRWMKMVSMILNVWKRWTFLCLISVWQICWREKKWYFRCLISKPVIGNTVKNRWNSGRRMFWWLRAFTDWMKNFPMNCQKKTSIRYISAHWHS